MSGLLLKKFARSPDLESYEDGGQNEQMVLSFEFYGERCEGILNLLMDFYQFILEFNNGSFFIQ